MQLRSFVTGFLFLFSACVSSGRYDMKKIESDMSQSVQKTDVLVQKAQADYREKSALIEGLKKSNDPGFKEAEPSLRRHLGLMNLSLDKMNSRFKTMREASGKLVALAYSRNEVRAEDPQYPRVGEAMADFDHAAKDVNEAALDYSRESNTLADEVSSKKLFFNFDVGDFQKRVQKAIKTAQDQTAAMQKELDRAGSANAGQPLFEELSATGQKYTSQAQELPKISRDMNDAASGQAKISTLDPQWPEAKRVSDNFDAVVVDLRKLSETFQEQSERLKNPVKRVQ